MLVASPRKSVHHDERRYGFFPQIHKRLDSWSGLNWTPWEGPSIKHQLESLQTSDAVGRKPELMSYPTFHLIKLKVKETNGMRDQNCLYSVHIAVDYVNTWQIYIFGGPTKRRPFSKLPWWLSISKKPCRQSGRLLLDDLQRMQDGAEPSPRNKLNTTCPIKLLEFAAETTSTSPNFKGKLGQMKPQHLSTSLDQVDEFHKLSVKPTPALLRCHPVSAPGNVFRSERPAHRCHLQDGWWWRTKDSAWRNPRRWLGRQSNA